MMEININLFHERPMFSFRCTKKNKKLLRHCARIYKSDTEEFIMKAVNYYLTREARCKVTFSDVKKIINVKCDVLLQIYAEPSNGEVLCLDGSFYEVSDKCNSMPVENITYGKFKMADGYESEGLIIYLSEI